MSLPRYKLVTPEEFGQVKWGKKSRTESVAVTICQTKGDLVFDVVAVFDEGTMQSLVQIIRKTREKLSFNELSVIDKSIITEVGSILSLHYITALNNFLGTKSFPTAPKLHLDKSPVILKQIADELLKTAKKMLLVECDIFTSDTKLSPIVILIPEPSTVEKTINLMFGF